VAAKFHKAGGLVYEIAIKQSFSAAHALNGVGGTCEKLHGHNFTVEVFVSSHELNESGIVIDFRILKEWTDEVLKELDHKYLNEINYFKDFSSSSENIARFIYDRISERVTIHNLAVSKVTVWESEDARVTYNGKIQ
jgi:6-pyruvoyltetrahydropterin/6-carboxytetrahydropterin synthase